MLNEFLELFLGAFYNFIPEDYANRLYFASILSVVLLCLVCAAVLGLALIVVNGAFKALRGAFK